MPALDFNTASIICTWYLCLQIYVSNRKQNGCKYEYLTGTWNQINIIDRHATLIYLLVNLCAIPGLTETSAILELDTRLLTYQFHSQNGYKMMQSVTIVLLGLSIHCLNSQSLSEIYCREFRGAQMLFVNMLQFNGICPGYDANVTAALPPMRCAAACGLKRCSIFTFDTGRGNLMHEKTYGWQTMKCC